MRVDHGFSELRTERLRLRRSLPADAEAISAYRSDPDVQRHQGWGHTDPDHVRGEIEEMLARDPGDPAGWVQFTVVTLEDDRLVGDVGLRADTGEDVIMIGYTVDPAYQGRGYATEAIEALVAYAFDALDAPLVRAYADANNVASVRVADKVGLAIVERFEGTDEDGTWHGVRMERLRDDARTT